MLSSDWDRLLCHAQTISYTETPNNFLRIKVICGWACKIKTIKKQEQNNGRNLCKI